MLAKELQAQWQEERNMHLGNSVIRPHSNHKVWWSCDQCPDSLPHVWEAIVNNRTQGAGCPYCSGSKVCQHNTLARKAPQIAQFWDANMNHPLSPDQVTVFSNIRVRWKCSVCLHEWQASVAMKARSNTGCPKCAKANGNTRADGTRQNHPSFAKAKHALLEQWIMTETEKTEISLATHPYEASSSFGGAVVNVQRAGCTAGKLSHTIELAKEQLGALSVWGKGFVNAILWRLFVLILLLTLTSIRTVLVLLK